METNEIVPSQESANPQYLERRNITKPLFICGRKIEADLGDDDIVSLTQSGVEEMYGHNIIGKRLTEREVREYAQKTITGLKRYLKSVKGERDPMVTMVTGIDGVCRVRLGRIRIIIYDDGENLHVAPLYKKERGQKDSYQQPLDKLLNFMQKAKEESNMTSN